MHVHAAGKIYPTRWSGWRRWRPWWPRTKLLAREVNWLTSRLQGPFECTARVRYNTPAAPAVAELTGPDELTVCFAQPVAAITPGQAVVCYSGDRLLGGAWIDQVPAEAMVKESELAADGMV